MEKFEKIRDLLNGTEEEYKLGCELLTVACSAVPPETFSLLNTKHRLRIIYWLWYKWDSSFSRKGIAHASGTVAELFANGWCIRNEHMISIEVI